MAGDWQVYFNLPKQSAFFVRWSIYKFHLWQIEIGCRQGFGVALSQQSDLLIGPSASTPLGRCRKKRCHYLFRRYPNRRICPMLGQEMTRNNESAFFS
jgi:hypothetical protein